MTIFSVGASTPSEGFELKSGRFDSAGSNVGTTYLTKTFPAGGNQKIWTLSVWVKKSIVNGGQQNIICPTGTPESQLGFNGDYLHMYEGGSVFNLRTMEVFRDPSAWYHIVVAVDTTQTTEANRIKMYSNNELITVFNSPSEDNYPAQNTSLKWNAAVEHAISKYGHTTGAYFGGYMAEFYWIDNAQLTPSTFAATNEFTNQWQPINPVDIKPTLRFGTTGFYLPFSNEALADSFTDSSLAGEFPLSCDYIIVGGGGGGGASGVGQSGAVGGSGIVIIRYAADSPSAVGGTITSYTDSGTTYQVHSFTSTGSSSFGVGGHGITANGDTKNVRVSNHPGAASGHAHIIGSSLTDQSSTIAFDGTGDYLTVPDGADWDFGTDPFTMECWFNITDFDGGSGTETATFISSGDSSYGDWFFAVWSAAGIPTLGFFGPAGWKTGSSAINANTWYHAAITRSGNTWNLWLNGTAEAGTFPVTDSGSMTTSTELSIGRRYSSSAWKYLDGYLDEIRISNIARYTADFTPDTTAFTSDANTLLLIHSNTTMGSTTFTDSSSSAHTITANGNVDHVAPKIGLGMLAVNKVAQSYVSFPDSRDWDVFAAGSVFTLEAWIRFNTVPEDLVTYADFFTQAEDGSNAWRFGYDQSTAAGGCLWIWICLLYTSDAADE